MATITGYTAERMKIIEDSSVVNATITAGNLILVRNDGLLIDTGPLIDDNIVSASVDVNGDLIFVQHDGGLVNAGNVIGPTGPASTSFAGGTFTGDVTFAAKVTVGDANTDIMQVKAMQIDTHTRTVDLVYTAGVLTSVLEKNGATTLKTTTLTYTSGKLTSTSEVADGVTVTTTLTYNGVGDLDLVTRAVA